MQLRKKQTGAVLIIGIVMLLILSIIVVAGSKSTMLQQKMASNLRHKELSFQAAETAIDTAENILRSKTPLQLRNMIFDDTNGYYNFNKYRKFTEDSDWSALNTIDSGENLHQVVEAPEYIVESIIGIQPPGGSLQVPKPMDSYYFRITGKGKGGTNETTTVLQTIFKK